MLLFQHTIEVNTVLVGVKGLQPSHKTNSTCAWVACRSLCCWCWCCWSAGGSSCCPSTANSSSSSRSGSAAALPLPATGTADPSSQPIRRLSLHPEGRMNEWKNDAAGNKVSGTSIIDLDWRRNWKRWKRNVDWQIQPLLAVSLSSSMSDKYCWVWGSELSQHAREVWEPLD